MSKLLVVGVGNILLSDEGVGVVVAKELIKEQLPTGVEVIDAGCSLADALLNFEGLERVIIIDAVRGSGQPGDVYMFDASVLKKDGISPKCSASLHEIGIAESIALAELSGWEAPEITVIGVEPEKLDLNIGLSDTINSKLEGIISLVREEIRRTVESGD